MLTTMYLQTHTLDYEILHKIDKGLQLSNADAICLVKLDFTEHL